MTLQQALHRRQFLGQTSVGLGALAWLLNQDAKGAIYPAPVKPLAKRVIYLFQSDGPSHMDLFDYKPVLRKLHSKQLPDSIRKGQRLTGMTARQKTHPVWAPPFKFARQGDRGTWVSELLPHTAKVVDNLCILKSVHTEAINHDPGVTFINTGSQIPGRPSLGAWLSYGLGSENQNLPAYLVLLSQGTGKRPGQPLFSRLWGNGFLPSSHQGSLLRSGKDPVLYLSDPPGMDRSMRRSMLDDLAELNGLHQKKVKDPELEARVSQYEMAFRMQRAVPELVDLSKETKATFDLYGPESGIPGSYAANCLLARRMAERGVRFVQLFHRGWDQHKRLTHDLRNQCNDVDQASAALITDLKRRGLLEDTLVIWGGEFGRTIYCQGRLGAPSAGRDHHGRCFTMWMAGGGIQPLDYGQTDDYCYNVTENPVHIHDLNATILHCLGIDHRKFTFSFQGLDHRLTGVEEASVIDDILA